MDPAAAGNLLRVWYHANPALGLVGLAALLAGLAIGYAIGSRRRTH